MEVDQTRPSRRRSHDRCSRDRRWPDCARAIILTIVLLLTAVLLWTGLIAVLNRAVAAPSGSLPIQVTESVAAAV